MPTKRKPTAKKVQQVVNTFAEAMIGIDPSCYGTPLNQTTTLWKNNRWYLVSNQRQLLSESYVEHGIIQTVVDVPVDDGLRGGVEIKTKQLSPEQIEELNSFMEENNDLGVMGQGLKWNRLFGGGGVLIITDQDPKTPLDIEQLKQGEKIAFHAVDLWELCYSLVNTEAFIPYQVNNPQGNYNYYGIQVHPSRVLRLSGIEAPSFVRPKMRGWGVSVVEVMINSINQYLKTNNLVFEVLDEFKIDVYKMKNLASTLLSQGPRKVQERVQTANLQKNYNHAVVLDAEDDFLQKQLVFSGLADVMVGIRMQIASDLRMPLTKVFGISAQGFNSGQDDIENYNGMVESQVRTKSKFYILQMIKLRCIQLFGMIPDDMSISFNPLRVLTAEQEENVKTQRFNRILQASQVGLMTVEEFKVASNKDDLLCIQLDTSLDRVDIGGDQENVGDASPGGSSKSTIDAPEAKS